jgi:hypothetical protein
MVATQTCRHGFNRPQVGAGSVCHCRKPTLLLQPTRQLFLQNSCSSHHRCRRYKGPRFARLARVQALSPKDDAASGSCPDHRQILPDQCSRYPTLHRSLRELRFHRPDTTFARFRSLAEREFLAGNSTRWVAGCDAGQFRFFDKSAMLPMESNSRSGRAQAKLAFPGSKMPEAPVPW